MPLTLLENTDIWIFFFYTFSRGPDLHFKGKGKHGIHDLPRETLIHEVKISRFPKIYTYFSFFISCLERMIATETQVWEKLVKILTPVCARKRQIKISSLCTRTFNRLWPEGKHLNCKEHLPWRRLFLVTIWTCSSHGIVYVKSCSSTQKQNRNMTFTWSKEFLELLLKAYKLSCRRLI